MESKAETAHMLFLDIIGYSLMSQEMQLRLIGALNEIVRNTPAFTAEENADRMALPTGDGMAIAFFRNTHSPALCALEIGKAVADTPLLKLRMGIHVGPVVCVKDVNQQRNLAGEGINMAQRVMDCGDAGHILLSTAYAGFLMPFEEWRVCLTDLGECVVKHGVKVHLYCLSKGGVGRTDLPSKFKGTPVDKKETTAPAPNLYHSGKTVTLLYKRNAPHSNHLMDVLEQELKAAGYRVFIDRHLKVGVEWANELKRQVRESYAVVPLLSAESIWSEMLESEIETAYEAQQSQKGTPHILPVRVAYEGDLTEGLRHILDPLQYFLWRGKQDDKALATSLLESLKNPRTIAPSVVLEQAGGAVPLESKFYIERPTDGLFLHAVKSRDSIVLVKGARQMGKTSLLARGLQEARTMGASCIRTDFQKLSLAMMETEEKFYLSLAQILCDQLDLEKEPTEVFRDSRPPSANFERYLIREVLEKRDTPVVWALDEVDKLFTCPFGGDVFALIRTWHNDRAYEPNGPWSKLTMAIAYATEPHLFITNLNQSPFNVGTRLALDDFTLTQFEELNARYGSPLRSQEETNRFYHLVGGQPYLSRRGLDNLANRAVTLDQLEAGADRDEGVFGDHLRRLLVALSTDEGTLKTVRQILNGAAALDSAMFYRLRSGGLIVGASERDFRIRCRLYETYLKQRIG